MEPHSAMDRMGEPTVLPSCHSSRMASSESMKSDSDLWPKDSCAKTPAASGESTTGYLPGSTGTELRRKAVCSAMAARIVSVKPFNSSKRVAPFCQWPENFFSPSAISQEKDRPQVW